MKIWSCKIGEIDAAKLPKGSDAPMREAIARAYEELTGEEPRFIFSGWNAELTDGERMVVNDHAPIIRPLTKPVPVMVKHELRMDELPGVAYPRDNKEYVTLRLGSAALTMSIRNIEPGSMRAMTLAEQLQHAATIRRVKEVFFEDSDDPLQYPDSVLEHAEDW